MLKQAHIKNFQAIEDLTIDFDPQITIIVGPTDIGKSGTIRAIWWAVSNTPSGDDFIRWGSKTASVELVFDKFTILRQRGVKNIYMMDGRVFEAFGNDVPSDIVEALNMEILNFQGQFDNPYWFSETAGEVSRQLNRIVDLGLIDTSLSNIGSMVRKVRAEVDITKERLEGAKKERKALGFARQMDEELQNIEAIEAKLVDISKEVESLKDTIDRAELYQGRVEHAAERLTNGEDAVELGEAWAEAYKGRKRLQEHLTILEELEVKANIQVPDISHLEELAEDLTTIKRIRISLESMIQTLEENEDRICQKQDELKEAEKTWKKQMGGACPLCGQQIRS